MTLLFDFNTLYSIIDGSLLLFIDDHRRFQEVVSANPTLVRVSIVHIDRRRRRDVHLAIRDWDCCCKGSTLSELR
jgi:hypothetical protein